MKNSFYSALFLMLAITLVSAQPEQAPVKMTYSGYWESDAGTKDKFSWVVMEGTECCGIWNINFKGTSKDKFGFSKVSGSCGDGTCSFEQVYVQGKFKGRTYTYAGQPELNENGELAKVSGTYQRKGDSNSGKFVFDKFTAAKKK